MFRRNKDSRVVLIFLDVDGVLNTTAARYTKYELRDVNISALRLLQDKLEKRGNVVKVTWRFGYEFDYERCSKQVQSLICKLGQAGITIYDKTPIYKDKTRDVEIKRYIRGYQLKNEHTEYIILDDDASVFDRNALKEMNFYKVNESTGLTTKDTDIIVKMLR